MVSKFFRKFRKFVKIAIVVRIRGSQSVARSENDQLNQNERISRRSFPAKRIIWNSSLLHVFYKMTILRRKIAPYLKQSILIWFRRHSMFSVPIKWFQKYHHRLLYNSTRSSSDHKTVKNLPLNENCLSFTIFLSEHAKEDCSNIYPWNQVHVGPQLTNQHVNLSLFIAIPITFSIGKSWLTTRKLWLKLLLLEQRTTSSREPRNRRLLLTQKMLSSPTTLLPRSVHPLTQKFLNLQAVSGITEETEGRLVTISQTTRNVMQSADKNAQYWQIEFDTQERW